MANANTIPLSALDLSDEQLDMIFDAAKLPEPPEGWADYDIKVARALLAHLAPSPTTDGSTAK
jgi:hypothetical protein